MSNRVNLRIANVAQETGALLREYLENRGLVIYGHTQAITISYGISCRDHLCLNANVGGGDKMRRLNQMTGGGCRTVPWFSGSVVPRGFRFPALARKMSGHGGTDIVPVFQRQEVPWRVAAGWDWFSTYVPLQTEFRVWIYRDELLDVYEKTMQRPHEYAYVGRNFRNGFDFTHRANGYPIEAVTQAKTAIRALQFDFGAIDMLLGEDGNIYILEVNTAPGVLKSHAEATLAKLADRMVDWVLEGCPERNY